MTRDRFRDRKDAGQALAAALEKFHGQDIVVLALARGGVPVGFEVARALHAPLDVVLVRKIGAPYQPELALGAVVDGPNPEVVLNYPEAEIDPETRRYIDDEVARQRQEIERRRKLYRGRHATVPVKGRTAIVVDDGIATGASIRAALKAVRRSEPRCLVLAVPVAPPESFAQIQQEADEAIALMLPEWFGAVGAFYDSFGQTSDDEVCTLLSEAERFVSED